MIFFLASQWVFKQVSEFAAVAAQGTTSSHLSPVTGWFAYFSRSFSRS
jgi:hypothetical protein